MLTGQAFASATKGCPTERPQAMGYPQYPTPHLCRHLIALQSAFAEAALAAPLSWVRCFLRPLAWVGTHESHRTAVCGAGRVVRGLEWNSRRQSRHHSASACRQGEAMLNDSARVQGKQHRMLVNVGASHKGHTHTHVQRWRSVLGRLIAGRVDGRGQCLRDNQRHTCVTEQNDSQDNMRNLVAYFPT